MNDRREDAEQRHGREEGGEDSERDTARQTQIAKMDT